MTDRPTPSPSPARAPLRGRLAGLLADAPGPLTIVELWEALGPLGGRARPSKWTVQAALDELVGSGLVRRTTVYLRLGSIHTPRLKPVTAYLAAAPSPQTSRETEAPR